MSKELAPYTGSAISRTFELPNLSGGVDTMTFDIHFSADEFAQIEKAYHLIHHPIIVESAMKGGNLEREVLSRIPWAGQLVDRGRSLQAIRQTIAAISLNLLPDLLSSFPDPQTPAILAEIRDTLRPVVGIPVESL